MTPKEKAQEFINKFDLPSGLMSSERKQCALIAVDEILENYSTSCSDCQDEQQKKFEYFQQVKQEIEKL